MKLEIPNGSYFVFTDEDPYGNKEYDLRMWLYRNEFEGYIERRPYIRQHPRSPLELEDLYNPHYNQYFNPYYMECRQEIGYLLNYKCIKYSYTDDVYKTEFIKNGMYIVATGSHLLFLEPGEYKVLPSGLKILPNE